MKTNPNNKATIPTPEVINQVSPTLTGSSGLKREKATALAEWSDADFIEELSGSISLLTK